MTDNKADRFPRRLRRLPWRREPREELGRHLEQENHFRRELLSLLPHLRGHALALTGAPDRADDLLQDSCERALKRWRQWNGSGPLAAWMLRILYNRWRDQLRADAVRATEPLVEDGHDMVTAPSQLHNALLGQTLRGIESMVPEQRAVLLLVSVEGLSYTEAAQVLGIPVGTVRSRVSRARAALVERLFAGDEPLAKSAERIRK